MEKLKFEFTIKPAVDEKSNFMAITSITTVDERKYKIPDAYQNINQHDELMKTAAYKKIKNTLTKRHHARKVWITLTEGLQNIYLDEDKNLQFKDQYLEELIPAQAIVSNSDTTEKTLTQILEKLIDKKSEGNQNTERNPKKLSEKFVLEKFTGEDPNVTQWIELFESECSRLNIEKDTEKIEVFRLFLEKSCINWYSSMLIKNTLNSEWNTWKNNFCETYADKGWTSIKYAISFKYINGSLLDYALKKEKKFLELHKNFDNKILIDLIAAGLPDFVTDKINRQALKVPADLFNELRSLEHLTKKKRYEKKNETLPNFQNKRQEKKPCSFCEILGKRNRYHPEAACWFKNNGDDKDGNKNRIRSVNNFEIETELNDTNQKN